MQLLFYARSDNRQRQRLMAAVQMALPHPALQAFQNLSALKEQLCTIVDPESIAVLSAMDTTELLEMHTLGPLLTEIFIVLVVPDKHKRTLHLAHILLPRFICQNGDKFDDLQEVLKKIARTPH